MPIDADGNRAEMIVDPKSTVSRLNIGRLYERYIKAGMLKTKNLVKEVTRGRDAYELSDNELFTAFELVVGFTDILENEQTMAYRDVVNANDKDAMIDIINEITNDNFYIYLTTDSEKRKYEITLDIQNSKYAPPYGKVAYTYKGKDIISERGVLIAPMYIMLLSKIADTTLATSSAKVNHFGLPVVVSKVNKFSKPSRESPVRNIGETEGRLIVAYGGRRFLAELKDRSASVISHAIAYRNILRADIPTDIEILIDRKEHPYGSDRGLEILDSLWNSVGMELAYVKDSHEEYQYEEVLDENITDINSIEDLGEVDADEE